MSTQSLPWFRMYTDFLMDPKMIALAFEDQRHFIGILALKSDGALDQDCCPDLMDRIVAQRLWIDHAIIRDVKKRLVAAELIDSDWQPLAWNKRQMRSDADPTNAERQRRHRERQKAAKEAKEKAALEAKKKAQAEAEQAGKDAENDSNALRNAPVTELDTDTDVDTDVDIEKTNKKEIDANASGVCLGSELNTSETYQQVTTKGAVTTYCRSQGINATPNSVKLNRLMADGAEMMHFVEAVEIAKERNKSNWGYVLGIVGNLLAEAAKPTAPERTASRRGERFDPLAYVNRNRTPQGGFDVVDV